ncbi:hypothetical protein [Streptomyces tubercidicus]|uniref:hypothetical protein n=1 Tax=Streptomyces tubercidicus TaxID=47759 RepID=UPI003675472D
MAETINVTPKTNEKYPLQMWGMNLGMYEVTEKNWPEFFVRIRLYEEFGNAPMLKDSGKPFSITPEVAQQHIGCKLGDKVEERAEWWLRIMKGRARTLEYAVTEFDGSIEFPEDDDEL